MRPLIEDHGTASVHIIFQFLSLIVTAHTQRLSPRTRSPEEPATRGNRTMPGRALADISVSHQSQSDLERGSGSRNADTGASKKRDASLRAGENTRSTVPSQQRPNTALAARGGPRGGVNSLPVRESNPERPALRRVKRPVAPVARRPLGLKPSPEPSFSSSGRSETNSRGRTPEPGAPSIDTDWEQTLGSESVERFGRRPSPSHASSGSRGRKRKEVSNKSSSRGESSSQNVFESTAQTVSQNTAPEVSQGTAQTASQRPTRTVSQSPARTVSQSPTPTASQRPARTVTLGSGQSLSQRSARSVSQHQGLTPSQDAERSVPQSSARGDLADDMSANLSLGSQQGDLAGDMSADSSYTAPTPPFQWQNKQPRTPHLGRMDVPPLTTLTADAVRVAASGRTKRRELLARAKNLTGGTLNRRHRRFTAEERAQTCRLKAEGAKTRDLEILTGASRSNIQGEYTQWKRENNRPVRHQESHTIQERAEAVQRMRNGDPPEDIAADMNIPVGTIRWYWKMEQG